MGELFRDYECRVYSMKFIMHITQNHLFQLISFLIFIFTSYSLIASPINTSEIVAELKFTPQIPEIRSSESLIVIHGEVHGEPINFTWDYSEVGGVITNGLMSTTISSTVPGTVSIYFDNDFNIPNNMQGPNDWYLRFTLGNSAPGYTIYNSMETFSIPEAPYCLITLRKGSDGTELRNRYYNVNNLMTALVSQADYDPENNTLRMSGSIKSTWGTDWIQADFNVLVGGLHDRQASLNQSSFKHAY